MPPKPKEVQPLEDTNPYGLLLTVIVKSANLKLGARDVIPEAPSPQKGAAALPVDPNRTHTSITWPTTLACFPSEPLSAVEEGIYPYNFKKQCRREPTLDTLDILLNNPIVINIYDSLSGLIIARLPIDALPFALGEQSVIVDGAALECFETPANALKVLPGSVISYEAQLHVRVPYEQPPVEVTSVVPTPTTGPGAPRAKSPTSPPKTPGGGAGVKGAQKQAATPPPAEPELPEPTPYTFLAPDVAESYNVAELRLGSATPVPANLAALVEAQAGRLSFSAGMTLPDGSKLVCTAGSIKEGSIVWPGTCRRLLTEDACHKIRLHLEDQKPIFLQMARFLVADNAADNAWDYYHGVGQLSLWPQLLVREAREAAENVATWTLSSAQPQLISCLPTYTPPGKAKSIEEPPAPPASGPPQCVWEVSATNLSVALKLARPLVKAWTPPTPPARKLEELVPPRDLTPKPPPTTATDTFKSQVDSIVKALATEYIASFPSNVSADDILSVEAAAHKRRALVFALNQSGKYTQLKDAMKKSVVAIVCEQYKKSGSMSPNEMGPLYAELYKHLLNSVHEVLATLSDQAPKPPPPKIPDDAELARLLRLAEECEVSGQLSRAEQLHQQRLVTQTNAQVWYEYGEYCMRCSSLVRAEQALQEALALEQGHTPALRALACLLLHQGKEEDVMHLEGAEVSMAELRAREPENMALWALSHMVYQAAGPSREQDATSCIEELRRLARESQIDGADDLACNAYFAAAQILDNLWLPARALDALDLASAMRPWGADITGEVELIRARSQQRLGNYEEAAISLKAAVRALPGLDVRCNMLEGDLARTAGRLLDAEMAYQNALARNAAACPLAVYLHLARCYESQGAWEHAGTVYAAGVTAYPCCSTWLGAGIAAAERGQLETADLALSEANVHDNGQPLAWGYLALVALKQGNTTEAEQALRYGWKVGLNNRRVLAEIISTYMDMGHSRAAVGVAQKLVAGDNSYESFLLLGKALVQDEQSSAARQAFEQAMNLSKSDSDYDIALDLFNRA